MAMDFPILKPPPASFSSSPKASSSPMATSTMTATLTTTTTTTTTSSSATPTTAAASSLSAALAMHPPSSAAPSPFTSTLSSQLRHQQQQRFPADLPANPSPSLSSSSSNSSSAPFLVPHPPLHLHHHHHLTHHYHHRSPSPAAASGTSSACLIQPISAAASAAFGDTKKRGTMARSVDKQMEEEQSLRFIDQDRKALHDAKDYVSRRGRRNGLANVMDARGSPKDVGFLIRSPSDWSLMADESLVYQLPNQPKLELSKSMEDFEEDFRRHQRAKPGVEDCEERMQSFSLTRMEEDDEENDPDPAVTEEEVEDQNKLHRNGRGQNQDPFHQPARPTARAMVKPRYQQQQQQQQQHQHQKPKEVVSGNFVPSQEWSTPFSFQPVQAHQQLPPAQPQSTFGFLEPKARSFQF